MQGEGEGLILCAGEYPQIPDEVRRGINGRDTAHLMLICQRTLALLPRELTYTHCEYELQQMKFTSGFLAN